MVADKTGIGSGGGSKVPTTGGGSKVPTTPSPVVKKKPSPYVTKRKVPLGIGIVTPEMEKYQAMLAKNPTSRVFAALAESYRKQGMLDEAIHLCVDGVKRYPNYMSGRVALGRAYFDKGMIKEARGELEKVVSITPNNIIANKVLGELHLIEEDIEGAKEYYQKVVSMSPDDEDIAAKLSDIEAGKNPLAAVIKEMKGEEEEVEDKEDVKGKAVKKGKSEEVMEEEGEELGLDADEDADEDEDTTSDESLDNFFDDIDDGIADDEIIEDIEEIEPEPDEDEIDGYVGDQLDLDLEEGGEDIQLEGEDIQLEEEEIQLVGEGEDNFEIGAGIDTTEFADEDKISIDDDYGESGVEDDLGVGDDLDISVNDVEVVGLSDEEVGQGEKDKVEDEFGILDEIFDSGEGVDDLTKAVEEYSEQEEIPSEIEIESDIVKEVPEGVESGESEIVEIGGEISTEDQGLDGFEPDIVGVETVLQGELGGETSTEDQGFDDFESDMEGVEPGVEGELEGEIDGKDVDISTETIADIYVKQGYFERALPIYEELTVAFPTRRTLREKVSHVRKKINEMRGEIAIGGEMGISSQGGGDVVGEDILGKNIQNLKKWLNNVRKLRRISS